MNYLILIVGALILVAIITDIARTTFSSKGAGFFTNLVTKTTWKVALKIAGNDGSKNFLEYAGIVQ